MRQAQPRHGAAIHPRAIWFIRALSHKVTHIYDNCVPPRTPATVVVRQGRVALIHMQAHLSSARPPRLTTTGATAACVNVQTSGSCCAARLTTRYNYARYKGRLEASVQISSVRCPRHDRWQSCDRLVNRSCAALHRWADNRCANTSIL